MFATVLEQIQDPTLLKAPSIRLYPPTWILTSHSQNKFDNFLFGGGAASLALWILVTVSLDQFAMPSPDRVWLDDDAELLKILFFERHSLDGKESTLALRLEMSHQTNRVGLFARS
jgi:hypothetical protein